MTVDDRLSLLALTDDEPVVYGATVVHRDQHIVHVTTDDLVAVPIGDVVALLAPSRTSNGEVSNGEAWLAVVSEGPGAPITALRLLERRH